MTKLARPLLYGMALLVVLTVLVLQNLILGDAYTSTAGWVGFAAIAAGVCLAAESSARAADMKRGATGVAGLSMPAVAILYTMLAAGLWLLSPVLFSSIAVGLHLILFFMVAFGLAT